MANEVTINIESSLAAMAFVVADQQEQIKTLREQKSAIETQYANYLHSTAEELDKLHQEIDELTKDCQDRLGIISEKEDKIAELQKDYDALYDANIDMCKQVNEFKDKLLQWHPIETEDAQFTDYPLGITTEEHPNICLLIKVEYIKDGMWDGNNKPIPVSAQTIMTAYPSIIDHQWTLNNNDSYVKVLAWCMVSDKNFKV